MNNSDMLTALRQSVNEVRILKGEEPFTDEDFERQAQVQTPIRDIAYMDNEFDEPDYETMWEQRYGAPPFWK